MAETLSEKVKAFGEKKIAQAKINAALRETEKWTWEKTQARIQALEAAVEALKKGK